MQNTFKERLELIMNYLDPKSDRSFAESIGIKYSKLQTYFKGSRPGIDVLDIILCKQSWINAEWLITGNGEMIKAEIQEEVSEQQLDNNTLLQIIQSQQRTIETLVEKFQVGIADTA